MNILHGQGVSKGIQRGTIYFYSRRQAVVEPRQTGDVAGERERLAQARERAGSQLQEMAELARAQAGESAALLFETHAMFLEDEDYTGAMDELVDQGYNAEYAVQQAGEQFSACWPGWTTLICRSGPPM